MAAHRSVTTATTPHSKEPFFNDTATTEIYTLSLHDALPITMTLRDQVLALRTGDRVEVTWQHSRHGPLTYTGTAQLAMPDGVSFVSRAYMPPAGAA